MATWMDVMALVRALQDKRGRGQALDGDDAERLVALLLEFHGRAVASTPVPDAPPGRARSGS